MTEDQIREQLGDTIRKLTLMARDVAKVAERAAKLDEALAAQKQRSTRPCPYPSAYMTHRGTIACSRCAYAPGFAGETALDRNLRDREAVDSPHPFVDGPICGCEACTANRNDAR
jgi:hypothetical protein